MTYLDEALDLLRQQARDIITNPNHPADRYPTIRMAVEALNDNHSAFINTLERER
jgi:hypothetical protein